MIKPNHITYKPLDHSTNVLELRRFSGKYLQISELFVIHQYNFYWIVFMCKQFPISQISKNNLTILIIRYSLIAFEKLFCTYCNVLHVTFTSSKLHFFYEKKKTIKEILEINKKDE